MTCSGFRFNTAKSIICRSAAAADLGVLAQSILGEKVLVVTDARLRALGLLDGAVSSLQLHGKQVVVFDAVEPDPSVDTVLAAVALARAALVDSVVGFGGGSSLDVAKVAALLLGNGASLEAAWGVDQAQGPRLPLVLVPTTSGTGSEVTPVAILTVSEEEKRGVSSAHLLPDLALLDAALTTGLPASITAATGIDAMVHAIEAYSSANANNNPLSKLLAGKALELLGANIVTACVDPQNLPAREAMLLGSMLAGQAFANSPVAAVHALAYPIGSRFHVPHGLSNAVVLCAVMRFNMPAAQDAYAQMAHFAFPELAQIEQSQRAAAFIEALAGLMGELHMPLRLRDLDIPQSALAGLARDAMKQQRLLQNNPRPVDEAAAFDIYSASY